MKPKLIISTQLGWKRFSFTRKAKCCWFSPLLLVMLAFMLGIAFPAGSRSSERATDCIATTITERGRPALAILVSLDRRGKPKSYGTGFFISGDGVLVTARHVAQAQDNLMAITSNGQRYPVTGFLGEDRDYDIAVLKINGNGFAHLPLAPASLPAVNQWVAVLSPTDQWAALFDRTNHVSPVCSTGVVDSIISLPGLFAMITTKVPVQHGQSGSPLLNQSCEVIGVVPYLSPEEYASASPASVVQQLLAKVGSAGPIPFSKRPRKGDNVRLFLDDGFRAGISAFERQDWKAAESLMKRAARSFPESALPLAVLGMVQVKQGNWKQAHAYLAKALQLRPECGLISLLDGLCLTSLGRIEGMTEVRRAIDLGLPDQATLTSAWALLARMEAALGHEEPAREALKTLEGLDAAQATALRDELRATKPAPANAPR